MCTSSSEPRYNLGGQLCVSKVLCKLLIELVTASVLNGRTLSRIGDLNSWIYLIEKDAVDGLAKSKCAHVSDGGGLLGTVTRSFNVEILRCHQS